LLNKSVTITSDDPENPTTTISVRALIEVEFDFESPSLHVGRLAEKDSVTRLAYLRFKSVEPIKILDITSSSPLISARQIGGPGEGSDSNRIGFEITVAPGFPKGTFSETITVRSDHPRKPEATLHVSGVIPEDVELTRKSISFFIRGTGDSARYRPDSLFVVNNMAGQLLEVLGARDSSNRLNLEVTPVEEGRRYKLKVMPKVQDPASEGHVEGNVIITTNNPAYKEVTLPYNIVWQQ
jgi:hypothetical protein